MIHYSCEQTGLIAMNGGKGGVRKKGEMRGEMEGEGRTCQSHGSSGHHCEAVKEYKTKKKVRGDAWAHVQKRLRFFQNLKDKKQERKIDRMRLLLLASLNFYI